MFDNAVYIKNNLTDNVKKLELKLEESKSKLNFNGNQLAIFLNNSKQLFKDMDDKITELNHRVIKFFFLLKNKLYSIVLFKM